ncbi:MAG: hypothetical protein AB4080_08560 [Trichodesmium sp.]
MALKIRKKRDSVVNLHKLKQMLYLSEFSWVNSAIGMMLPILLAQRSITQVPEIEAIIVVFCIIFYLIIGRFLYEIYEKLNVENAWFAWIPILNTYITFVAGDEENPVLWTILSLIPCISIIAEIKVIIAWVRIFKKLEKSPWLLLLCLIPFAALFVFGYVALT